jgi:hypothetical protein
MNIKIESIPPIVITEHKLPKLNHFPQATKLVIEGTDLWRVALSPDKIEHKRIQLQRDYIRMMKEHEHTNH